VASEDNVDTTVRSFDVPESAWYRPVSPSAVARPAKGSRRDATGTKGEEEVCCICLTRLRVPVVACCLFTRLSASRVCCVCVGVRVCMYACMY
jgi:hypothetical protein